MEPRIAAKPQQFEESVIRLMTRLAWPPTASICRRGFRTSRRRRRSRTRPARRSTPTSTSTRSPGARARCARRSRASSRGATAWTLVADEQVTVCCGATEAMMSTMMAIIDPGDEVVVFEPFYENYGPDAILSGATPRYVTLHAPGLVASIPTSSRRRSTTKTQGDHHQHAEQPDRQGVHARRSSR